MVNLDPRREDQYMYVNKDFSDESKEQTGMIEVMRKSEFIICKRKCIENVK